MPPSPRRVVVDGGGNTALDMARAARCLGDEAVIVYRRTREKMPEHDFEVQEALEEGVTINWLRTITHMNEGSLVVEKMELDADGYSQPTGEVEAIAGNTLVLALGQNVDMRVLERIPSVTMTKDGVVAVGPNMMTGYEGIVAGGDVGPSAHSGCPECSIDCSSSRTLVAGCVVSSGGGTS